MNRRMFLTRTLGAVTAGMAVTLPTAVITEHLPPVVPPDGLEGWVVFLDARDAVVARCRSRFVITHVGETTHIRTADPVSLTIKETGVVRAGFQFGDNQVPVMLSDVYDVMPGETITILA